MRAIVLTCVAALGLGGLAQAQSGYVEGRVGIIPPSGHGYGGVNGYVQWSTVDSGQFSKMTRPGTWVLTTQGDWQRFYNRLTGNPPGTAPGNDWSRFYLVAIALGERKSAGYKTYVRMVSTPRQGELIVEYVEEVPGSSMNAQVLTQPYVVVRIERSAGLNPMFKKVTQQAFNPVTPPPYPYPPYYPYPPGYYIPYSMFWEGRHCSLLNRAQYVIWNQRELIAYWGRIFGRNAPNLPVCDWETEILVAVHIGSQISPGARIEVVSVTPKPGGVAELRYAVVPGRGGMNPGGPESPFVVLRLPRGEVNDVRFMLVSEAELYR